MDDLRSCTTVAGFLTTLHFPMLHATFDKHVYIAIEYVHTIQNQCPIQHESLLYSLLRILRIQRYVLIGSRAGIQIFIQCPKASLRIYKSCVGPAKPGKSPGAGIPGDIGAG